MADETFEQADAGSSLTVPQQAGTIKKNAYIVIGGHPCKVVDISTSKTGKHGHAKANIVGVDIFTGKKYEDVCPTSHNVEVPVIKRKDYQLIDISHDGFLQLMDKETNDMKEDYQLDLENNEMDQKLKAAFDEGKDLSVTIMCAMDQEGIATFKEMST